MSRSPARLSLVIISVALALGGCERKWKGDHIEPLKPMAASPWEREQVAQAGAASVPSEDPYAGAPDCPAEIFLFEPEGRLSVTEAGLLAAEDAGPATKLADGATARLAYRQFDYEDNARRGSRDGLAVVYAKTSDGRVVGGVLWVVGGPGASAPTGEFAQVGGEAVLRFRLPPTHQRPMGCVGRFEFRLTQQGALVAQGKGVSDLSKAGS